MKIKILINGYKGRMGKYCLREFKNNKKFSIVEVNNQKSLLNQKIKNSKPDIVIDFTNPSSVFENLNVIIKNNTKAVVGTTGLKNRDLKILKEKCKKKSLGMIISPNFSLSANLSMIFSKLACNFFSKTEIVESHHEKKIDLPSGTSIRTAKLINNFYIQKKEVPIHSLRLKGIISKQDIIFGREGEILKISSNITDRTGYMYGIKLACNKVLKLKKLIYGLENIILKKIF